MKPINGQTIKFCSIMARSKEPAGKGKGVASSSTSNKRARIESEQSSPCENCPDWPQNKRLSEFPEVWREQMYRKKVTDVQLKSKLIIPERPGNSADFKNYGVTACFERLGWLNAFTIEGFDEDEIYLDEIITWMATLKKTPGRNPPRTTKLVGIVRGQKVELSFRTLDTIGSFDNSGKPYEFLSDEEITSEGKNKGTMWIEMLRELFAVPESKLSMNMALDRNKLKPLPKLMSTILSWNILPRVSDQASIRNSNVRMLYALCTGRPMISFKQLVLHNLWESRENAQRKKIPHCRLLTRLLLNAQVIHENAKVYPNKCIPFDRANIRTSEFTFAKSKVACVLVDVKSKRKYESIRSNEDDQDEDEDEEDDGDETEDDEEVEEQEFDIMDQPEEAVRPETRPAAWDSWNSHEREMYMAAKSWRDEQARIFNDWRISHENSLKTWQDEQERIATQRWEQQQTYEKSMIYEQEWYRNRRFDYEENMRHYFNHRAGLEYQEHGIQVDWKTIPRYTSDQAHQPCPQSFPSRWLPRELSFAPPPEASSSQAPPSDPSLATRTNQIPGEDWMHNGWI
ncbi:hypothetical protein QVD17_04051 [Tagetes erecta]|uniref:Putative plant transposon protein domain-containing protein n=1 Tax=Tagetes erecta TaxID=13708 RepID=A0AAD8L9F5_TARER|nr:hypothetical protein QVD17_04051 [Tagetes erecta]